MVGAWKSFRLGPELGNNSTCANSNHTVFAIRNFLSCRFMHAQPVAYQAMLLTTILSALKQQHLCHMHRHWIETVVTVMPYVGKALGNLVTSVVDQICRNLELLSGLYDKNEGGTSKR